MMKRIITALRKPALVAGFLLSAAAAFAQTYPGQFPANTVYGNTTGSQAAPTPGQVVGGQIASGAAATNVGTLGGQLSGTLPNPNIATGTVTNANHANMAAGTVKANPTASSAAPIDWQIGASSNVRTTGVPGTDGQELFFSEEPTTAATTQQSTIRIDRVPTYTGGTPSNLYAALRLNNFPSANITDNEWSIVGVTQNSATAGQNGGAFFSGQRMVAGGGPTWGMNALCQDTTGTATPASGALCIGTEVDVQANGGPDTNVTRVILALYGGKFTGGGATPTISKAIDIGAQNATLANATFTHGIFFNVATYTDLINVSASASSTNGIDLSAGAFSGSPFKSQGFTVTSGGSVQIAAGQTISLNASTSLDGTFTTGTTAPVLTANKPGATTSIGTWLKVVISGSTFWVPAWSN